MQYANGHDGEIPRNRVRFNHYPSIHHFQIQENNDQNRVLQNEQQNCRINDIRRGNRELASLSNHDNVEESNHRSCALPSGQRNDHQDNHLVTNSGICNSQRVHGNENSHQSALESACQPTLEETNRREDILNNSEQIEIPKNGSQNFAASNGGQNYVQTNSRQNYVQSGGRQNDHRNDAQENNPCNDRQNGQRNFPINNY